MTAGAYSAAMKTTLDGVRLKLGRADECLAFLDTGRTLLLAQHRDGLIGQLDPEGTDYVFRVQGDAPPLDWGIQVGEFAHALRSSLDNLIWWLVESRGSTPSTGSDGRKPTQFPIYEHETDRQGQANVEKARTSTAGVSTDDFTFIEARQPYKHGRMLAKWDPLALLDYLSKVDKHRYIHAAFAAASIVPAGGPYAGRMFFQSRAAEWTTRMGLLDTDDPALWEEIPSPEGSTANVRNAPSEVRPERSPDPHRFAQRRPRAVRVPPVCRGQRRRSRRSRPYPRMGPRPP